METSAAVQMRALLRSVVRFDRTRLSLAAPVRNTIGVAAPLAIGAAVGQPVIGLTICIGALEVAFSDQPGPYSRRAGAMLLTGLATALSVFVGSTTGVVPWLAVAVALLWGFGGGILVALGTTASQVGLASIIVLLVFSATPLAPEQAARSAGLVLAGALLQTVLAILAWPVRRFGPQRNVLAHVFGSLGAYARAPSDASAPPPATQEITEASQALRGGALDASASGEALRGLLDEAERIRLTLLGVSHQRTTEQAGVDMDAETALVTDALQAAADVLDAIAAGLPSAHPPVDVAEPLHRLEAVQQRMRQTLRDDPRHPQMLAAVAYSDTLLRELRAATRMANEIAEHPSEWSGGGQEHPLRLITRPPALRLRDPASVLRSNLTLRSAAFRHAVRLAVCLALADALAYRLDIARGYWVPLTVAIVLKPDFTATFTRGIARVAGTLIGLFLTTGLVLVLFGETPGRIALVAILTFLVRSVGPANYGLLVIAVSGLVVTLTSFAGARPEATIMERGINTLIGGALALFLYAVWPTWERTQTPAILADVLDAYRAYFHAVLATYLEPASAGSAHIERLRLSARLARSNAEASLTRLSAEPATPGEELDRDAGLLASSHRFVNATMELEAWLIERPSQPTPSAPAELRDFAADVETTLAAQASALRGGVAALDRLPDLASDFRRLADAQGTDIAEDQPGAPRAEWTAPLVELAERITEAANSMTQLLRGSDNGMAEKSRERERL